LRESLHDRVGRAGRASQPPKRNAFEYLRYGYAAAATLTMFLATALVVYVQYLIVRRWRRAFAS
jgi:hypothetical protein